MPVALSVSEPAAAVTPTGGRGGRTRLAPVGRVILAAASGYAITLAFPDTNLWPLAPLGVAGLALAILGVRARWAFLLGLVAGLTYFAPVLSWSGTYVGSVPWLALATLEALYVAVMCAVVAAVQRPLRRAGHCALAWALVPLGWVVGEWARSTTPFGGFPWARLGHSQADSPLVRVATLAGTTGIGFTVACVGTLLAAAALAAYRRRWVRMATLVGGAGALLLAPLLIVLPTDGRTTTVALIQGNVPVAGLDFNAQRRAVLDNHVRGTLTLALDRPKDLSVVLWPENSSDIDPLKNPDAAAEIQQSLTAVDAPILVGAVLDGPGEYISNAALFYPRPGVAPQEYIKLHPVPFGEYIPYRSFFRTFSTQVDLVRRDFAAGRDYVSFTVGSGADAFALVPTTCFEVAYDDLVRGALGHAGHDRPSLLVVQTNNATFGYTAESTQQLAISRIQAIEHGRSVAHVSTVGVSAFIAPDGTVSGRTSLFTAAQVVGHPVLRTGTTIADRLGTIPEAIALVTLIAAACGALVLARRRRRTR